MRDVKVYEHPVTRTLELPPWPEWLRVRLREEVAKLEASPLDGGFAWPLRLCGAEAMRSHDHPWLYLSTWICMRLGPFRQRWCVYSVAGGSVIAEPRRGEEAA
jgi:hypothetical protein